MLRLTGFVSLFFPSSSPVAQRSLFNMFGIHKFEITQNPKIVYEYEIHTSEPLSIERLIDASIPVPMK